MESLNIDSYINLINKLNIKQILKYFQTKDKNLRVAGNLESFSPEEVLIKMMSEYRHKDRKDWLTKLKTVKKSSGNSYSNKKHPGFVYPVF